MLITHSFAYFFVPLFPSNLFAPRLPLVLGTPGRGLSTLLLDAIAKCDSDLRPTGALLDARGGGSGLWWVRNPSKNP